MWPCRWIRAEVKGTADSTEPAGVLLWLPAGRSGQVFELITARQVDQAMRRFAALDAPDVLHHLVDHQRGYRLAGDVGRDHDARMAPEWMLRCQRLLCEHVQHRPADLAGIQGSEQICLD